MGHTNGLVETIIDDGAGVVGRLKCRAVRGRLQATGSTAMADVPEFVFIVQVVATALGGHALGHGVHIHWADRKESHDITVGPQTRRVRLQALAQLCHAPEACPRTRCAFPPCHALAPATPT